MRKILVIDDEEMIGDLMKVILENMGHQVTTFYKSQDGEKSAIDNDYDLVLMDLRMPDKNGAELTRDILKAKPEARILIITAFPADPLAVRALDYGALALMKKTFDMGRIIDFLKE